MLTVQVIQLLNYITLNKKSDILRAKGYLFIRFIYIYIYIYLYEE